MGAVVDRGGKPDTSFLTSPGKKLRELHQDFLLRRGEGKKEPIIGFFHIV